MDALEALHTSPTYRAAWMRYQAANEGEDRAVTRSKMASAARIGLIWSELEVYLDALLALHRLQAAAEDSEEARGIALEGVRAAVGVKTPRGAPDLLAQRLRAYEGVERGTIAHALAADKLRASVDRYRRALILRIEVTEDLIRSPALLDLELCSRFGALGDLDRLRPLVHAIRAQRYSSGLVLSAADELAAARARVERAALLRDRALSVSEAQAAEEAHAAALAEVRAIERRDQGDGEDALAAGLRHAEALQAADRLPG